MNKLERELYNVIIEESEPEIHSDNIPAPIDYEDPRQVRDLVAGHLAKIFIATHKKKIKDELDKIKAMCK